jgi:hypothetical protein
MRYKSFNNVRLVVFDTMEDFARDYMNHNIDAGVQQ